MKGSSLIIIATNILYKVMEFENENVIFNIIFSFLEVVSNFKILLNGSILFSMFNFCITISYNYEVAYMPQI